LIRLLVGDGRRWQPRFMYPFPYPFSLAVPFSRLSSRVSLGRFVPSNIKGGSVLWITRFFSYSLWLTRFVWWVPGTNHIDCLPVISTHRTWSHLKLGWCFGWVDGGFFILCVILFRLVVFIILSTCFTNYVS
jgi:hypothetical protein